MSTKIAIFSTSDLRDHRAEFKRAVAAGCDVRVATTRDTLVPEDDWWRYHVPDSRLYKAESEPLPHPTRKYAYVYPRRMEYAYRGWMRLHRELVGSEFTGNPEDPPGYFNIVDVEFALRLRFATWRDFAND
jgi:hypothetical protein